MSKLKNLRERIHQPFYDHLVRGIGVTAIANSFQLFGSINNGQPQLTNMPTPSQFPSDNTVIVKCVRIALYFQSIADDEYTQSFGSIAAITGSVADANRALDMYSMMAYGAYFTFVVGTKPMIQAPVWYAPQGGGVAGWSSVASRNIANNGVPSQEAILKLAKDIQVVARQNISVRIDFYPFALLANGVGAGGASITAAVDPLAMLNQFDGIKSFAVILDGLLTRDVQ